MTQQLYVYDPQEADMLLNNVKKIVAYGAIKIPAIVKDSAYIFDDTGIPCYVFELEFAEEYGGMWWIDDIFCGFVD